MRVTKISQKRRHVGIRYAWSNLTQTRIGIVRKIYFLVFIDVTKFDERRRAVG